MPWLGIWFESLAGDGASRSPERFRGLVPPLVYPYAHGFVEDEAQRLLRTKDPSRIRRDGESLRVYYSLGHDSSLTAIDKQGCSILGWLFQHFETDSKSTLSARFSEIPVVIHTDDASKAAAMANALALLRFLSASEDQAIAKVMIHRWRVGHPDPSLAAREYEDRVLAFLSGEVFYPEDVTLFDVLERHDLKSHRELGPCCETQIGFVRPLLEWIDECWPRTDAERADLIAKIRSSLADEARYLRKRKKPASRGERARP